jgi:hypothetical protein
VRVRDKMLVITKTGDCSDALVRSARLIASMRTCKFGCRWIHGRPLLGARIIHDLLLRISFRVHQGKADIAISRRRRRPGLLSTTWARLPSRYRNGFAGVFTSCLFL